MNYYCLEVTSAGRNEVAISPCVMSEDGHVRLLVENLTESSSYNFTIISNNSIGEQSTAAVLFSKKDRLQLKTQMSIL